MSATHTNAAATNAAARDKDSVWDDISRRARDDAREPSQELLRRLGVPPADIASLLSSPGFERLVVRWAIEFPLNVRWYDAEIPKQQAYYNWSRTLAIIIGVATIVGTTLLVLWKPTVTVSQLGVLVAGIFGVLQVAAAGGDPKARLGGFRKARADLKESMFTFLETWTGRVVDRENSGKDSKGCLRPSPDFVTALLQEIRSGRRIVRDERDTYFGTFKSPTEILGAANTALDGLRARRTELGTALKEAGATETSHELAVSTRIQDLRNKLAEAAAQKAALENKKTRLMNDKATPAQLADVQGKIEDAETDRFKTQMLLDLAVKSDVAHPI
jgi:hypothetical protein